MPCVAPFPAFRLPSGDISLDRRSEAVAVAFLKLPCGTCIGCRMRRARDWSVRCMLELAEHPESCWCTLTYDDDHLPVTLSRRHFSLFLKRLRVGVAPFLRPRFFASGEYGDKTYRPHYHAILFGVPRVAAQFAVPACWRLGRVQVDACTPASVSYVAGYVAKKAASPLERREDRVDLSTGEFYRYQPPFLQMSRRPGVGGGVRRLWRSWRDSAVSDGTRLPVPRYLHAAWVDAASDLERRNLEDEQAGMPVLSRRELDAIAAISAARLSLSSDARSL